MDGTMVQLVPMWDSRLGEAQREPEQLLNPSMTLPPPRIRWTDRGTGTVVRRWFGGGV
jgi:hypothetical protein